MKAIRSSPPVSYTHLDVYKRKMVICGDGTDQELLDEEGICDMDAVVALTGLDEENIIPVSYTHLDVYKRQEYSKIAKGNEVMKHITANKGRKLRRISCRPVSRGMTVAQLGEKWLEGEMCIRDRLLTAFSRHFISLQIYAPLPEALPLLSYITCPSGVLTTRARADFSFFSLQATHCRTGIFFGI